MKKLLILTFCFAGLAAFVYFYEIAGQEERERAQELEESLFRVEEEDVRGVEITRQDTDPVVLEKVEDGWILEEPLQTVADQSTVDSFVGAVSSAKRSRTLETVESDVSAFGLDSPRATLTVSTEEEEKTLLIGKEDFTGNQLYVKFQEGEEVYLTGTSLLSSLEKEILEWRNKDALDFDRNKLAEIEISREGASFEFQKSDGEWQIREPVSELADQGAVGSLISSLASAEAEAFVEEEPSQLADYGLESPQIVVRLREEGSDAWEVLDIGASVDEAYFARNPNKGPVIELSGDVYDDLTKDLWDYRQKDVVTVPQSDIETLTLTREDLHLEVAYADFKWVIQKPEDLSGQEALSYKLWYPIDEIEFQSILEQNREFPVETELLIQLTDGSTQEYRFGGEEGEFYALQVETGRQGTITQEDYEKLQITPADIVEAASEGPADE